MVTKSRNHVSTGTRNLLYFILFSNNQRNDQIIKIDNQIFIIRIT